MIVRACIDHPPCKQTLQNGDRENMIKSAMACLLKQTDALGVSSSLDHRVKEVCLLEKYFYPQSCKHV
jgi:hypothetical protein